MPIYWTYLLKNYFKVLILSVVSFIAILLVARLEQIAKFAAIGAKPIHITLFTLYQIPYILPIATPLSCLVSALILFQRLSHTHELTALRAGGISIKSLIAPILIASGFLSLGNFYICSEMASSSHLAARRMIFDLTSVNPLILLESSKIAGLQQAFVQMEPIRNGEAAEDLIIAVHNPSANRLNLCLAQKVDVKDATLQAKNVTIISTVPSEQVRDHLMIENQKGMSSAAPQFASLLRKANWRVSNDHLKLSLLRARMADLRNSSSLKYLKKCQTEWIRRFSVGLSAFTFTLLGVAFGIEISRRASKKGILIVLVLSTMTLIAFCLAKELDEKTTIASLFLLLAHLIIFSASFWTLQRVNRGIE